MNEFNQMYTLVSAFQPALPQQAQTSPVQTSEPSKFESMLQRKQRETTGQKPAEEASKPSEPKAEEQPVAVRDEVYRESYLLSAAMAMQPHIVYMMDGQTVQQPEAAVETVSTEAARPTVEQPVSARSAPLVAMEQAGRIFEVPAEKPAQVTVSEVSAKPEQAAPRMEQPVETAAIEQTPVQPRQEREDTPQTDVRPQTQPQAAAKTEKKTEEVPIDENMPVFDELDAVPVKVAAPEKPEPQLDLDAPDAADRLAKKVVEAFVRGEQEIELQLSPEGLGRLSVVISKDEVGALSVVLHAANPKAAVLLQQHGEGLANTLAGAAKTEVHVEVREPQAQQQPQFMDPNGQNGRQQRQPQQEQRQRHNSSEDFMQKLRLGLVDLSYAV